VSAIAVDLVVTERALSSPSRSPVGDGGLVTPSSWLRCLHSAVGLTAAWHRFGHHSCRLKIALRTCRGGGESSRFSAISWSAVYNMAVINFAARAHRADNGENFRTINHEIGQRVMLVIQFTPCIEQQPSWPCKLYTQTDSNNRNIPQILCLQCNWPHARRRKQPMSRL